VIQKCPFQDNEVVLLGRHQGIFTPQPVN